MDRKTQAWILLLVCAAVAAFSGTLAFRSGGANEQYYGLMLMLFSGLVGITGPILSVLK
jgi:hypothetical protein